MYRVFCESYENFLKTFFENSCRMEIARIFDLIVDIEKFNVEKSKESEEYKKLCDLIFFMKENTKRFPKLKAFLWTLESRKIKPKEYNIAKKEDLEEQTKLANSFLKLAYWY